MGGGCGFTKTDLADAYNQVRLGPKSRERLALNTHRGVLLQNVLPFGISSAPGYFQQVMDKITMICPVQPFTRTTFSAVVREKSSRDPALTKVMRFAREGWPEKKDGDDPAEKFRKIADSFSVCHGCLLYGARVVIPAKLRRQVLDLLHECHFGIQRMKQLARTAFYWPNIDSDLLDLCRQCSTCAKASVRTVESFRPPVDVT